MSEVRGSGQECQAGTAQEWPRGATLVQGQGREPGAATPCLSPGSGAGRSHPTPEARGGSWEETPHGQGKGQRPGRATHIQESVAALVQVGLEELYHVEGQEGWQG